MTERIDRTAGLGRGLAALIPQRPVQPGPTEIPLSKIQRNPYQPRQRMAEAELQTLAESIRVHGVIQPVLVTETVDGYRLVAGERRVLAAEMAGLDRVPAIVRQLADREQLELALIENLQREDLNPIEAASAYRQLIDEFGFSQEDLASRVSRARSTVANTLRLLELEPAVREAIADSAISEGHGRALGGLPPEHQPAVLRTVLDRDLTVRDTEELVRRLREPRAGSDDAATTSPRDPDLERVEDDLRRSLGTKVSVARTRRGGRIVIEFFGEAELGRLYDRLVGSGR
jgi:ParB family chromosome partitioning protein